MKRDFDAAAYFLCKAEEEMAPAEFTGMTEHLQRMLTNYLVNALRYGMAPVEVIGRRRDGMVELLVCDDGSSDATQEIVRERARRDNRIQLIVNQHGGVSRNCNVGLKMAKFPWIARLDADDVQPGGAGALPWRLGNRLRRTLVDGAASMSPDSVKTAAGKVPLTMSAALGPSRSMRMSSGPSCRNEKPRSAWSSCMEETPISSVPPSTASTPRSESA